MIKHKLTCQARDSSCKVKIASTTGQPRNSTFLPFQAGIEAFDKVLGKCA